MKILLTAILLFACAAPVAAQTHPCDTTPAGPFVIKTGQAPAVGWCHPGASGFTVAADAGAAVDVSPTVSAPNASGLKYFEVRWSSGFQKGAHTFTVVAYNIDPTFGGRVAGPGVTVPFDVSDPIAAPVAPSRGRVIP